MKQKKNRITGILSLLMVLGIIVSLLSYGMEADAFLAGSFQRDIY